MKTYKVNVLHFIIGKNIGTYQKELLCIADDDRTYTFTVYRNNNFDVAHNWIIFAWKTSAKLSRRTRHLLETCESNKLVMQLIPKARYSRPQRPCLFRGYVSKLTVNNYDKGDLVEYLL